MTDAARPGLGARLAAASRDDAVRERFLRAVLAEVPLARVAEVHLFAPMRQGGVETGVAVVAARPEAGPEAGRGAAPDAPAERPLPNGSARPASDAPPGDPAAGGPPPGAAAPAPAAEAPAAEVASEVAPVEPVPPAAAPAAARHTVYTARYRLTVKGPDRGRWQVDVRAEADAPLLTVDAVVRGVQRRAGDASPPARLDPAECARAAGLGPGASAPGAPASAA